MSSVLRVRQGSQDPGILGVQGSCFLQLRSGRLEIIGRQCDHTEIQERTREIWVQLGRCFKLVRGAGLSSWSR